MKNYPTFNSNLMKGGLSDHEKLSQLLFFATCEGVYEVCTIWERIRPIAEAMGIEDAYHKLGSVLHTYATKGGTRYNKIERLGYATYRITYRLEAFA